jgi:glycosyltransferase involved in cell wall biosynthesis
MPEVASDSFDALICSHVLEHVADDRQALSELYRVLKPGGWGILMVPIILTLEEIDEDPQVTDEAERWRRFGQFDHVRLYNKSGFVDRVEAAGFVVRQLGMAYFGEAAFQQLGLTKTSVLYVAEKLARAELVSTVEDNLLTIILTTYNHKDTIAQAIESVLEQETTYPYQIWLCDDCSTDGTLQICEEYAAKYPGRIKLFAQPKNTYSDPSKMSHIHVAIRNVKTKYWCLLDGDDAWCNNQKVQTALDILENKPVYVTFAHDTLVNDLVHQHQKSLVHDILRIEIQNPVFFVNPPFLHISARVHRNVLKFDNDIEIHGDIYLYYRYLDKGPLYYHDKIMSIYNYTGRSMWSSVSPDAAARLSIIDNYRLNKYLNYRYDSFFTSRAGNPKLLVKLKKFLKPRISWEIWFFLMNIEHLLSQLKRRVLQSNPR